MYAEPTEPSIAGDLNAAMRRAMSKALKRAALMGIQLSGVRAVNWTGSKGGGCPTTPGNLKCWLWDIEILLTSLSRCGSEFYVDPQAKRVVVGVEVEGKRFRDVATECGMSRARVGEIMDLSASAFWRASVIYGKNLDPFEETA